MDQLVPDFSMIIIIMVEALLVSSNKHANFLISLFFHKLK